MKNIPKLMAIALSIFGAIVFFACAAPTQVNCANIDNWSSTNPPVNQTHIFCGEWSRNRPKGFHSRPGGLTPNTVENFKITQSANNQGIYGGTWNYSGHSSQTKFSTMFPDSCTQTQVLNSIIYAATYQQSCPSNAPRWACGPNAPSAKAENYCKSNNNNSLFTIAGAFLTDGKINTAFPLRATFNLS